MHKQLGDIQYDWDCWLLRLFHTMNGVRRRRVYSLMKFLKICDQKVDRGWPVLWYNLVTSITEWLDDHFTMQCLDESHRRIKKITALCGSIKGPTMEFQFDTSIAIGEHIPCERILKIDLRKDEWNKANANTKLIRIRTET